VTDEPADVFPAAIQAALDSLPPELRDAMSNVEILVEDQSVRGPGVLGLYEGIPLTKRGSGYNAALPDKITIFRGPLERLYGHDRALLEERIRHTVLHEVAHHFGISDERLIEIDRY
jgi:predicted Zn-dependent protease with MMP-like domain